MTGWTWNIYHKFEGSFTNLPVILSTFQDRQNNHIADRSVWL